LLNQNKSCSNLETCTSIWLWNRTGETWAGELSSSTWTWAVPFLLFRIHSDALVGFFTRYAYRHCNVYRYFVQMVKLWRKQVVFEHLFTQRIMRRKIQSYFRHGHSIYSKMNHNWDQSYGHRFKRSRFYRDKSSIIILPNSSRLVYLNRKIEIYNYLMVSVFRWPDPNTRECCES
jgi:hypothetical protein